MIKAVYIFSVMVLPMGMVGKSKSNRHTDWYHNCNLLVLDEPLVFS